MLVLAWMGDALWCGQTQNGMNLDFQFKFDLEGQSRSLYKIIGTLTRVFGVVGQASDWHTDRQTDSQTNGHTHTHRRRQRQYPKTQNGIG